MKIIFSVPCEFANWGMGYTAYHIAKSFYNCGILKYIIAPSYMKSEIPSNYIKTTYSTISPIIYRLPNLGIALQSFIRGLLHDILSLNKLTTTDIFYTWAGGSYFSIKKARKLNTKIVILENPTSHIINRLSVINEERKKFNFPLIHVPFLSYYLKEYELSDYIKVPSEYSYKSFIKAGVNNKKLILIPYGVDIKKFYPLNNKKIDKFRILYVGGITIHKGVHYLLEAVKMISHKLLNFELILVGHLFRDGVKILSYYSRFVNFKYIKFTRQLLPLYQNATIFVFPSYDEGSALVTYEAMACGLPIITTFESGSVIRDGIEGFIVPARNAKELADKILYLYHNKTLIKQMGEAAYQRAKEFSWEKVGEVLTKKLEYIVKTNFR